MNGHIFARLHVNGVCEVFAHHFNSKFFDDGADLEDVVPVIGIRVGTTLPDLGALAGSWTGQCTGFELGGVRFDATAAALTQTVKRFADWLMQERFSHNGVMGWSYQHDFDGKRRYYGGKDAWWELPGPGPAMWHQNSLARLLGYCTLRFGDPAYLDAWAESYAANLGASGDHGIATSAHPLPWLQSSLWQATLTGTGVRLKPLHFGPHTEKRAQILGPHGTLAVEWQDDGQVRVPTGVTVDR